jgi:hypothetical protein
MIAAGSKDCTNKFTGIMMGDWVNETQNTFATPGLYGIAKGTQVFGFKTDGTGFIGPEGKGQIRFDGNSAIIANGDGTCRINLNPQVLADKSAAFLYAEAEPPNNSTEYSNFLATLPSNKYYFAVHPSYGIFTSGIVFSKGTVSNANVDWLNFKEGQGEDSWGGTAHIGLAENNPYFISLAEEERDEQG